MTYEEKLVVLFQGDSKGLNNSVLKLIEGLDKTEDKLTAVKTALKKYGIQADITGDTTKDLEKNYATLMTHMQKGSKVSLQQIELLRMSLSNITKAVTEEFDAALGNASRLEQKMANIKATMGSNISDNELIQLKVDIREASVAIGQDADFIGEKITDALSAGVDKSVVVEQIKLASMAAKGTRGNLDSMVDLGNTITNVFGEAAGGLENVYDMVSKTYQVGDITGSEIAEGFGQVGGSAKAAGVGIKDLMTTIAIGSKTQKAAPLFTGLNAAITELNKSGSDAEKALQRLGYEDLQTALKKKTLVEIMAELNGSGEKMSDIFGRQAAKAVIAVGSSVENTDKVLKEFSDTAGTVNQVFKDASATLEFSTEQNKQYKAQLRETIGESMIPLQKSFLEIQNKLLANLIETSPQLKQFAGGLLFAGNAGAKAINGIGGVARNIAAIGQAQEAFKTMNIASKLSGIGTAMTKVGMSMSTTMPILLAGIAAYVALDMALKGWEKRIAANDAKASDNKIDTMKRELKEAIEYSDAMKVMDEETGRQRINVTKEDIKYLKDRGVILGDEEVTIQSLAERYEAMQGTIDRRIAANDKAIEVQKKADEAAKKLEEDLANIDKTEDDINKKKGKSVKLTAEQKKAEAERLAYIKETDKVISEAASIGDSVREQRREAALEATKSLEEYNALKVQYAKEDYDRWLEEVDRQVKAVGTVDNSAEKDRLDALNILKIQKEMLFQEEMLALNLDFTKKVRDKADIDAKEAAEAQQLRYDESLAQATVFFDKYNSVTSNVGDLLAASMVGAKEKQKEAFKGLLNDIVGFVERKLLAGITASAVQGLLTGGVSLIKDLPKIAVIKGLAAAMRAGISSYDSGGYSEAPETYYAGVREAHIPVDKSSSIGDDLANRLADKIGVGNTTVILQMDGEKMGQAQINHVNRRNKKLPRGRSVYDESVG